MASQRITIAKIGGAAGDVASQRLRDWVAARTTSDPNEWSNDQWPSDVRIQADAFADRLRANALALPVIHFVEWSDLWSMFDIFHRWLTPRDGPLLHICANRFELYVYFLPDGGRLARRLERRLKKAGPHQVPEEAQFVRRLHEAVRAWQELVKRVALIVLREPVGGCVCGSELIASLPIVPDWLSEG